MEQVGGDHYSKRAIEPIEFIEYNKLPFSIGNIVKYVTRWKDKGGKQDLQKALQYVDFVQRYEITTPQDLEIAPEEYISKNGLNEYEAMVIENIVTLSDNLSPRKRNVQLDKVKSALHSLEIGVTQRSAINASLVAKKIVLTEKEKKKGRKI